MASTIFKIGIGALGFAVPCFATVAALGVWTVTAYMTVLVAAKAFDIRAILPCVTCLHQPTVSASFGLQPKNHADDRRRGIWGSRDRGIEGWHKMSRRKSIWQRVVYLH